MPSMRRPASRTTANASGRSSSRISFSASFRESFVSLSSSGVDGVLIPSRRAAILARNSAVLFRRSACESALHPCFKFADSGDRRHQPFHYALVAGAKNLCESTTNQGESLPTTGHLRCNLYFTRLRAAEALRMSNQQRLSGHGDGSCHRPGRPGLRSAACTAPWSTGVHGPASPG